MSISCSGLRSVVATLVGVLSGTIMGGCGSVPATSASDNSGGVSGSTVDSDGDGFSDDLEVNSTPGTDPNDPTDNPNNVRDTDGDGCSDYDELNFANFCNNDPNTPSSSCEPTFYNAEYRYGFDLPDGAQLQSSDGGGLYYAYWTTTFEGVVVGVSTEVYNAPAKSLEQLVTDLNQIDEADGSTFVDSFPFSLADGTEAYFTSTIIAAGFVDYTLVTIADGFVYSLAAVVANDDFSDATDAYMIAFLDSFCID